MEIVTLQAHFDGERILLDEPYELKPNTKLVISVIHLPDDEREDLTRFSLTNLENTYREMAADEARESEALEWAEATTEDVADETR